MLKRVLIGFAVLFIIFISAVLILPGLIPTDTYRTRLEADLSRAFARDVKITGDIDLATFPVLKIETGAVSLANPEGFPQGKFVDVEAMSAKVRLWPLLRKRVEISGVTLKSPSIRLERQENGRANWVTKEAESTVDKGPFKRDGRFTEYDPALALLRIENGTLAYTDAAAEQNIIVENINIDMKAPGLDKTLSVDGAFIFDGLETAIEAEIKSPADFLNGLETNFATNVSTSEGMVDVIGQFLASDNMALTASFEVESKTPNALAGRLPLPTDLKLPTLSSISSAGDIFYGPESRKLSDLTLSVKGQGINADFNGDIDLSEGATNTGVFSANLDDMSVIQPYLDEPMEVLNVVNSVDTSGNASWTGSRFTITDMKASLTGSDLTASYTGKAAYESVLSLNGVFEGQTPNAYKLIEKAGLSQPDAAALKRLTAKGQIVFSDGKAALSNVAAEASEGFLNGTYNGDITYGETLDLNGQFSGEISDLTALDTALPRDIPYSDVAKRIKISSRIQSQGTGYSFSDLSADLQDGLLNGNFKGGLTLGEASDISGNLTLSAQSLRRIATTQKIDLPVSTDVGPIFETFSLSGAVSGTPDRISFKSGAIGLDDLTGRGDFVMEMGESKPLLSGALDLSSLDLRPYMAAWSAQNPTGEILPWSEDIITLAGLDSANAQVDITSPSIIMDRLELGATEGVVTLKGGVLTAELNNTKLYEGDAAGTFSIQSSGGVPTVNVDATIESVAAQNFFMASAGFEKVTGTSDITLSFEGRGKSQAEIMKNLSGDGIFKVLKGQLLGLDAGTLLSGVDQALSTRQLPQGIGIGKSTNFNDIEGEFSLTNGRATLSGFQLESGAFFMDAEGAIDIGQQTIDIGIRPKLAGGSDLAKFGIPLRFTGGFGQATPKLDTNLLGDIVKARARQKAGDTVRENLGGPLGSILGGVIGGQAPDPTPTEEEGSTTSSIPSNDTSTDDTTPEPENPETPEEEEPETPEEQISNALKDIFGRKKKN